MHHGAKQKLAEILTDCFNDFHTVFMMVVLAEAGARVRRHSSRSSPKVTARYLHSPPVFFQMGPGSRGQDWLQLY